jgi:glycosyltransferase involved in cell wall biosynthesis
MGRGHPNPRLTALAETPAYAAAVAEARALGLLDHQVFFNREWVPYDERGSYLLEADIGVSAHRDHVEAALAVRTRLYDYVWAGLPMIVSAGDSLSEELVGPAGLGAVVAPGDVAGWAAALEQMAREPDRRGARAAAFAQARAGLSWDRAVVPLAEFCLR